MVVSLRAATAGDLELTFGWANDLETRAASFHGATIERGEHERWLRSAISGERRLLFIAERAGVPVGVLRIERQSAERAELGITVAPEQRGQGLAVQVLQAGVERARELGLKLLLARIRPDNLRSLQSFARAGFLLVGRELVQGQPALCYELRLESPPSSSR